MKRNPILLSILLLTVLLSGSPTVQAAPLQQTGPITQTFGDPNGLAYLEVTFSGADFEKTTGTGLRNFYAGDYTGGVITLSGVAKATVVEGHSMDVKLTTYLGQQTYEYPPPGEVVYFWFW